MAQEALFLIMRDQIERCAGKPTTVYTPCAAFRQQMLSYAQCYAERLCIIMCIHILQVHPAASSRLNQNPPELLCIPCLHSFDKPFYSFVFSIIMHSTQSSTITRLLTDHWQFMPKLLRPYPTQCLLADASRHGIHFLPDGRIFRRQVIMAAAGIDYNQGIPAQIHLQRCNFRLILEIDRHKSTDGAGHLVHKSAWLSKVFILSILRNDRTFHRIDIVFPIQGIKDRYNQHFKSRGSRESASGSNIGCSTGVKAADLNSLFAHAASDSPDQRCRRALFAGNGTYLFKIQANRSKPFTMQVYLEVIPR